MERKPNTKILPGLRENGLEMNKESSIVLNGKVIRASIAESKGEKEADSPCLT